MSYDSDERSVTGNRVAELYDFVDAPGNVWRYTSSRRDVSFGGHTYTAAPIQRESMAEASVDDPPQFTISCAYDLAVVSANSFAATPSQGLTVAITRVMETGASLLCWSGFITSFTIEGRIAKATVPSSIDAALATTLPGAFFQAPCNHHLYDAMCTVNRTAFKLSTTVASSSGLVVTAASAGGHVDGYYAGGEVVHTADGQRRTILRQVGAVLTITAPFRGLVNGDAIDLYAGCDHMIRTCRDKFGNELNFGGMPYVPNINPFITALKLFS